MAFINNKILCTLNDDGTSYETVYTISQEIFLTRDRLASEYYYLGDNSLYEQAILSPIACRVIRVLLLNGDETVKEDISQYVLNDWNFSFGTDSGSTRSGAITLINTDNRWMPSPVRGTLWKGTKFKILVGLYYDGVVFWKDCGIFVASVPEIDLAKATIHLALYDKFSLLDGTIGGKRANAFKIPVGTTVFNAIKLCLSENKSNDAPYDSKPIIFPAEYATKTTPYTITKDVNTSMGDIILELATMVTCDASYNPAGNLTITKGAVTNDDLYNRAMQWVYADGQYNPPSLSIDFSSIINEVVVAGAIENGKQYKATVINKSPKSQMNIYLTESNPLYIEDNNIIGDTLCEARAKYEMVKQGRLGVSLNFSSVFLPHIDCNSLIMFNNKELQFLNEKFIVNSLSLSASDSMELSVSSVDEVVFK